MNRLLFFLLLACIPFLSHAQSLIGTVTDENGEPVIGAIIKAYQGGLSGIGTVSDIDGNYSLDLPAGKYDIVATYASYKAVTFSRYRVKAENTTLDIELLPDIIECGMFYCSFYLMQKRTDCFSWEYTNKFFDEKEEPWFSPNPASNVLNITYKDVSGQFFITDMTGQLISTFAAKPEGKTTIDIFISYHYNTNKRISGKFSVLH